MTYLLVLGCCLVVAESSSLDLDNVQNVLLRNNGSFENDLEPCNLNGKNNKLCFFTSKSAPYQIAVINSTANTAIVLDCMGRKAVVINGSKGHVVILNGYLNTGTYIESPPVSTASLFEIIANYKVQETYNNNTQNVFKFNRDSRVKTSSKNIEVEQLILYVFKTLGKTFQSYAQTTIGSGQVVAGTMKLFDEAEHLVRSMISRFIDLHTGGWLVLKSDALAIWEVIRTFSMFATRCGLRKLTSLNIRIPLGKMIGTLNGLESFNFIMSELARKTQLVNIISFMGQSPIISMRIIAGLGGMSLQGSSGVFTIVSHIVEQLLKDTLKTSAHVNDITDMVLLFFRERSKARLPVGQEIYAGTERLKKLFTEKNKKKILTPLIEMMDSVRGQKTLKIRNVNVAQAFKILSDPNVPDAVTMAFSIIKIFAPLKIPRLVNNALAGVYSGSVRMMTRSENRVSIGELLPGTSLTPEDGVIRSSIQPVSLRNLTTIEIIKSVPQFQALFAVLDRNAVNRYNMSLYDKLKKDRQFKNQINAAMTQAMRRALA